MRVLPRTTASALLCVAACVPQKNISVAPAAAESVSTPQAAPSTAEPSLPSVTVDNIVKARETRCDLAQGADARVETPFLAIVRDDAGYRGLMEQAGIELPPLEEGFFPSGIVLAAFLGVRSTPGYRVLVSHEGDRFRIVEEGPPQDAILAQVITTPFAVAAYALGPDDNFTVDLGDRLGAAFKRLRIAKGTLEISGGNAGRWGTFALTGDVRVASLGDLTTLFLDVSGNTEVRSAQLETVVTFRRGADGRFAIALPNAGSFVPPPCREVILAGRIGGEGPKMFATIAPGRCSAADAFSANGTVQAAPAD